MKANISEFSYGFALTSELVGSAGGALRAAPVFPSLYREGQPGGGWDVKLELPGVPLFLQFKLSDYMSRATCIEARAGLLSLPCYRMYLRKSPSLQHQMLLDLESTGAEVYYVAPRFHQPDDLNDAFLSQTVGTRSIWVLPSVIGPIRDREQHHVSFNRAGKMLILSEPRYIDHPCDFEAVLSRLNAAYRGRGNSPLRMELMDLAEQMEIIGRRRWDIRALHHETGRRELFDRTPIERIAHYASVFLESQFFVFQRAPG